MSSSVRVPALVLFAFAWAMVSPHSVLARPSGASPVAGAPDVVVTTDKLSYQFRDTIIVTITNNLSVSIYAVAGQTYCTIVSLERRSDDQWHREGACAVGAPPGFMAVAAGAQRRVEVAPATAFDRHLVPGSYRVAFSFFIGSTAGPQETVHSPDFVISGS